MGYVLCTTYVCTWYQRALRCQLRGRPFHPRAGRLRFSGEAHPGPATLTQSSSFSCGAGLQSENRLLLCCAPVTRDHATQCHAYSRVLAAGAAVQCRCCVRFRALDQLLQPHQTVLRPHLPTARPSLVPRDAQPQAWGGKPEAAASLLLPVSL